MMHNRSQIQTAPLDAIIGGHGYGVLPFVLCIDCSRSMEGRQFEAINAEVPRNHQSSASEPMLADIAWLSKMTFNDETVTLLPLSGLSGAAEIVDGSLTSIVGSVRAAGDGRSELVIPAMQGAWRVIPLDEMD